VIGLVGESGSGKSTVALGIIGLLPPLNTRIGKNSSVLFEGKQLLGLNEKELEKVRGTGIGMIFQEPLTSANPLFTIGDQLAEAVKIGIERHTNPAHQSASKETVHKECISWLKKVGLPDPKSSLHKYPHELSGGMRQRVMIAMAMAAKPSLILADEPTSALDVTTQAQILALFRSLIRENKMAVLFISHDLAVVAQIADRVAVMYSGMIVEEASVYEIFENPLHPYTQALIESFPDEESKARDLAVIPGSVPNLNAPPKGCPFHPRCKFAREACLTDKLEHKEVSALHRVSCILY